MFRAIIFDLDGTLVDSYPALHESLNFTLRTLGLKPVDIKTTKRLVGRGLENLIREAAGEENLIRGIEAFKKSYDEIHLDGTFLLPEVYQILELLHHRGVKMAVASNKPSDYSKNILHHLSIEKFFLYFTGPEQVGATKPNPAMLQELMRLMDVTEKETLYVGDMVLDAETASNAGVRVALISTGGNSHEELKAANPDYLFRRISELLKLL